MKKALSILMMCLVTSVASAQKQDVFNHVSAGVTVGTPGWGIDVAAPVCDYVSFRTGFTSMPGFKFKPTLNVGDIAAADKNTVGNMEGINYPNEIKVQGKLKFFNWKFLFDVYPFKNSSFHVTVGAYLGNKDLVEITNVEDGALMGINQANAEIDKYNSGQKTGGVLPAKQIKKVGLEIGDHLITPDENGNAEAEIRVNSFKPYVGIGFGRAVPKKNRFNVQGELGVMFWGKPKLYSGDVEITEESVDGNSGKILKTMSKITVFPVLNLRLTYRIF